MYLPWRAAWSAERVPQRACYFVLASFAHAQVSAAAIRRWTTRSRNSGPGIYQAYRTNSCSPCCRRAFRRRFPRQAACPARSNRRQPLTIGDLLFGDNRQTPEDYRSGAFQKVSFVNTYLPRLGGADGFGIYGVRADERVGHSLSHDQRAAGHHARLRHAVAGRPRRAERARAIARGLRGVPLAAEAWRPLPRRHRRAAQLQQRLGRQHAIAPCGSWATAPAFSIGRRIFRSCSAAPISTGPDIELLPIAGFIWTPDRDVEYQARFSDAEDFVVHLGQ